MVGRVIHELQCHKLELAGMEIPRVPPPVMAINIHSLSPNSGFCAISSRLWGSEALHCSDVSSPRERVSPAPPSALPDSPTSLGPCSTLAKHVKCSARGECWGGGEGGEGGE